MGDVTVLGPLWLLFYLLFFKVKLFNSEEVQGKETWRLALTLVEKVAAQFSVKTHKHPHLRPSFTHFTTTLLGSHRLTRFGIQYPTLCRKIVKRTLFLYR